MTFDEFQQKLLLAKTTIISSRARLALLAANDLSATVKLRIQETGQDANGAQFSPYTPQYAIKGSPETLPVLASLWVPVHFDEAKAIPCLWEGAKPSRCRSPCLPADSAAGSGTRRGSSRGSPRPARPMPKAVSRSPRRSSSIHPPTSTLPASRTSPIPPSR